MLFKLRVYFRKNLQAMSEPNLIIIVCGVLYKIQTKFSGMFWHNKVRLIIKNFLENIAHLNGLVDVF